MNKLRVLLVSVFLVLGMVPLAQAQTTTTSTTLSAAIADANVTTITVASATGFTANTTMAYVDNEAMDVVSVSGTTITVARGRHGTLAMPHTSGELVYVGPLGNGPFVNFRKYGACTSGSELYLPQIDIPTGGVGRCTNSEWDWEENISRIESKLDLDLLLLTTSDGRQVELNSRNFSQTSGDSIGFRVAPAQNVTSTGTLFGGQITPRLNNDIDLANIIGLHVDAYVRGTAAKTISGDVRALQLELVTDDAGTNTVSGDVNAIRVRAAFSASTLTGDMVPLKIEVAETQTNSQQWDAVFELTSTISGVWSDTDTATGDTEAGFFKVIINGNARYVMTFSDAGG